jgi:hypothetical protein
MKCIWHTGISHGFHRRCTALLSLQVLSCYCLSYRCRSRNGYCCCTPHPCPVTAVGRLTAAALCQAVAVLQPADAVLVDESLTTGNAYWEASKVCHTVVLHVCAAATCFCMVCQT